MTEWRLVLDGRCPSKLNMARDIALFQSLFEKEHQGILRIYNWDEPAVTIGFHQKNFALFDPVLSLPIFKRPTGGGAVLHVDDLTFSICTREKGVFAKGILAMCGIISEIFACALKSCGLDVEMKGDHTAFSDVCFMRSTPVELHLNGSKILGLALLRSRGCILLQGVMPLRVDRSLSHRVFGDESAPDTKGILDYAPWFRQDGFAACLADAFSSQIGVTFLEGSDDDHEQHESHEGKIDLGRHKPRDKHLADQ